MIKRLLLGSARRSLYYLGYITTFRNSLTMSMTRVDQFL